MSIQHVVNQIIVVDKKLSNVSFFKCLSHHAEKTGKSLKLTKLTYQFLTYVQVCNPLQYSPFLPVVDIYFNQIVMNQQVNISPQYTHNNLAVVQRMDYSVCLHTIYYITSTLIHFTFMNIKRA